MSLPSSALFRYTTLFRSAPRPGALPSGVGELLPPPFGGREVDGAGDRLRRDAGPRRRPVLLGRGGQVSAGGDRKSTRLNSSHGYISYAVFCLKKKNRANK